MNEPSQPQSMGPSQPGAIAPWLLISFIVVLLGGGGYLGWYLWNQSQAKTTTPTTIPTTTTPSTTTPTISTADWKTYTNTKYSYSFKYPNNFYITNGLYVPTSSERVSQDQYIFIDKVKPANDAYKDGTGSTGELVRIVTIDKINDLDSLLKSETDAYVITETKIGNERAIKKVSKQLNILSKYDTLVYSNHDNIGYKVSWDNTDVSGAHDSTIDTILSTFQFTK